jgi:hypothetical protein
MIRTPALLLIALSALAPALIYAYALAAFVSARAVARPLLLGGVFAWLVFRIVSGALQSRLNEYEQVVLAFWSRTPFFVVMTALVLSALPLFLLPALAGRERWTPSPALLGVLAVGILVLAAAVVWSLWQRFQASLPGAETPE